MVMRSYGLQNHINDALGCGAGDYLPELAAIQEKFAVMASHQYENDHPWLYGETFNNYPVGASLNKKIQTIADGIKAIGSPLKLYEGEAKQHWWTGEFLTEKKTKTVPQYKLNFKSHNLRFDLDDGDDLGRVHVQMYEVEPSDQGSWYDCKFFWLELLKPLLLEHCGFFSIWGRAAYSVDHSVKGSPPPEKDWRRGYRFMGWDSGLKPIYVNKLQLLYLRLGFICNPIQMLEVERGNLDQQQANEVHLLSDKGAEDFKKEFGSEVYNEFKKYDYRRVKQWREIQRQRSAKIDSVTAAKIKKETLTQLKERRKILEL